jgi:hypothetical protein
VFVFTAKVLCDGSPRVGVDVIFSALARDLVKSGHNHDTGNLPLVFVNANGFPDPYCRTLQDGTCQVGFSLPEVSGMFEVKAQRVDNLTVAASVELDVGVVGLVNLPDAIDYLRSNIYKLSGGTPIHPAGSNHFTSVALAKQINCMADRYRERTGRQISLNDMSLKFGGLFDVTGNWTNQPDGHNLHRSGGDVDIDHATQVAATGQLIHIEKTDVDLRIAAEDCEMVRVPEGMDSIHFRLVPR